MNDGKVAVTVKLDKALHKKLKQYCLDKEVTIKDLFIQCMERLIVEEESKKGK